MCTSCSAACHVSLCLVCRHDIGFYWMMIALKKKVKMYVVPPSVRYRWMAPPVEPSLATERRRKRFPTGTWVREIYIWHLSRSWIWNANFSVKHCREKKCHIFPRDLEPWGAVHMLQHEFSLNANLENYIIKCVTLYCIMQNALQNC